MAREDLRASFTRSTCLHSGARDSQTAVLTSLHTCTHVGNVVCVATFTRNTQTNHVSATTRILFQALSSPVRHKKGNCCNETQTLQPQAWHTCAVQQGHYNPEQVSYTQKQTSTVLRTSPRRLTDPGKFSDGPRSYRAMPTFNYHTNLFCRLRAFYIESCDNSLQQ